MTLVQNTQLADLLDQHLKRVRMGEARLATLVNANTGNSSFLHRSTIRNWRTGVSKSANDWRKLTAVATILRLNENETDALLTSAGCPQLKELITTSHESDRSFLNYWETLEKPLTPLMQPSSDSKPVALYSYTTLRRSLSLFLVVALLAIGVYWWIPTGVGGNQQENLVRNPNFDSGSAEWVTYTHPTATAQFSSTQQSMHLKVTATSEKIWHVSFFQSYLDIKKGKSYKLHFRARGEPRNSVKVDVTRNENPKTSVAPQEARQKITVTKDWKTHTVGFTARESVIQKDGGARILFEMGHSEPGQIWFDDIEFIVVE